ncbi:MAG: O-antigen ligase family protein [Patescibacteria group bacterium]
MKWHQRFFWLLLLFLPTQLGYHFWPQWAGVLGRRVDYLAPTIYLTDILIFLIIVAWVVPRVVQMVRGNPKSKFLNPKQIQKFKIQILQTKYLWMMAGVVFAIVNIFVATNKPIAIYKWIKVSEFVMLGWYIVRTRPTLSAIITPLSVGILYSSILAIIQFILQHSVGGPLWWLGERTFGVDTPGIARYDFNFQLLTLNFQLFGLRPHATFPHPNVLGGFLAVVLPLLIYNLQIYKSTNLQMNDSLKKMLQWGLGLTISIGVVALILTFSRSAVVVGAIAIALTIARIRNDARPERGRRELRIMNSKRFVVTAVIGLLIILLASYFMIHNSTEESVVVRGQLNAAAIKLWQTAPLFGVGLGNFLVRLPETLPTRTIYFLQPVHNIYLLILSETGVVGFLPVLLLLVKIFLWTINNKQKARESFVYCLLLTALLVLGLVDHYLLTLQQGQLLLTVFTGLSLTLLQNNKITK